jgi:hypothetical protein
MIEPINLAIHIRTQIAMANKETAMVKLDGEFFPTMTYIVRKRIIFSD